MFVAQFTEQLLLIPEDVKSNLVFGNIYILVNSFTLASFSIYVIFKHHFTKKVDSSGIQTWIVIEKCEHVDHKVGRRAFGGVFVQYHSRHEDETPGQVFIVKPKTNCQKIEAGNVPRLKKATLQKFLSDVFLKK